jgi:hypothetical protein
MVDRPVLLAPQKIPVDEDASLPHFPNLVEAIRNKFDVTPSFVMAHRQHSLSRNSSSCCIAYYLTTLYQSITRPIGPLLYDIPNNTEPSSEENKASCIAHHEKKSSL